MTDKKPAKKKTAKQAAIDAARGFIKKKKKSTVGQVQDADPSFAYYYFDRNGLNKGRERNLRSKLEDRGYEESADGEYVIGQDAVIYKIPIEAYKILFDQRCKDAEQRMNRLEHAKKEARKRDSLKALEEAILDSDPEIVGRLKGLLTDN